MRDEHLRISWHRLRNWVEIKAIGDKAYYEHFGCGWYSYQPLDGNYDNLIVSQEELEDKLKIAVDCLKRQLDEWWSVDVSDTLEQLGELK